MKIFIGADHVGYFLKEKIKTALQEMKHEVVDMGANSYNRDDDYPDFIIPVAKEVAKDSLAMGVIIGGSGQGEAIAANRIKGARAAVFNGQYKRNDGIETPDEISLSREHNNANILSIGARFVPDEMAIEAVLRWISIPFSAESRHVRRIAKIDENT